MLLSVIAFIIAIIVHESAHAWAAFLLGDPTAKNAGRLTLNPLAHADIIGTVLLPFLLIISRAPVIFGWAKPVPIDPRNFANPRLGNLITSLAGPMSNFTIAAISGAVVRSGLLPPGNIVTVLLFYIVIVNLVLGLFNLIPVPPLDGSGILFSILPQRVSMNLYWMEKYGFIILIALLYLGALNRLIMPLVVFFTHLLLS